MENLLLKLEFYIPELSENLLCNLLKNKKKIQNELQMSQYVKLFILKSVGLVIKNIKLPSSNKAISQFDFAKFMLLLLTSQIPQLKLIKTFIKGDIMKKFTVIPIFLTISEYLKKILINKMEMTLTIE